MRTARDIIDAMGGATELASQLSRLFPEHQLSRDAVYNWPARGVPALWLVPLQVLLKERGIEMSAAELMALTGPRRAA